MRTLHIALLMSGLAVGLGAVATTAQEAPLEEPLPVFPLGDLQPPEPDVAGFIINRTAAAQLGKALFWDINAGSDGQACASCHFHAGADIRLRNQINPGGVKLTNQTFDQSFEIPNDTTGPNKLQTPGEFPFMQDTREKNDRMSSQGTFAGAFISGTQTATEPAPMGQFRGRNPQTLEATTAEACVRTPEEGNPFHPNGQIMFRKVEPRHTPSVINAAFNLRQFWDGRARSVFNGVDPFGAETNAARADAGILVKQGRGIVLQQVAIANASLASQAAGPPLSTFEMSCSERTFADIGRRLIFMTPLAEQEVHPEDSLFGRSRGLIPRRRGLNGLSTTYENMIKQAFNGAYYSARGKFTINEDGSVVPDENGYTQLEHNFSLFWSLAIMEYQRTLISNDTPFDRGLTGEAELAGLDVFLNDGLCADCHSGPLFSGATSVQADANPLIPDLQIESMTMADGRNAIYDGGFYNIGVRPTNEDRGVGGNDPWGNPLSFARPIAERRIPPLRDAVDGAFKTPILRNVGLTPPYMHNGGLESLEEVVEFYDRGGRRIVNGNCDSTGTAYPNNGNFAENDSRIDSKECTNFDPDVKQLGLSDDQKSNLVAFLKSLTDDRVACHSGVFDHPSLPLTDGHVPELANPGNPDDFAAKDIIRILPATGASGLRGIGKECFPNSGNLFGEMQTRFEDIAPTPAGVANAQQP